MRLFLRKATMEDAKDVLRWRNDPVTRENSFTRDEIDLDSHLTWFEKKLGQEECFMYILMADDEKVGNIRVDASEGVGEISYMVAPEHRGKGYGKKMIGLLEAELSKDAKDAPIHTLFGLTIKSNAASGKCFIANDYAGTEEKDSYKFTKSI